MADGFDRWRDLLAADPNTLSGSDLVDRWQLGVEVQSLALNPMFQFVLASLKDHYLTALTGKEGEDPNSLMSIRAGLRNIDVITQVMEDIVWKADMARERVEKAEAS